MPRALDKPEPVALTPKYLVESLGEFDLDPCAAPYWPLAKKNYVIEHGQNGLALPWYGRVWLHPPVSRASDFLDRLSMVGNGIALVYARVETEWFHKLVWQRATGVLFLKGRLTFLDRDQQPYKANAGGPSCLVAYGNSNVRALADFAMPGRLVILSKTIEVQ